MEDWQRERSRQFFALDSQDETAGNKTCQASLAEDGSITLNLRLPNTLADHGKQLRIPGVRFAYGHDQIVSALQSSKIISAITQDGKVTRKRIGTAISYRFVRDDHKGWRVFATVEAPPVAITSSRLAGAIGVDINVDHLAVSETDRFGNLLAASRIPLVTYGKTTEQVKVLIGDAVNNIARQAQRASKPEVIKKLNFQNKKAACFRHGVEVIEINPAYTSVIGAVNHAQLKEVSVHQGAAYAVARRGLGLSEKPTRRKAIVPVRAGGHVTFELPVRNRSKHVWSHWSAIRTRLRAAHVAHYRSGLSKEKPAPLSPEMRALGAIRSSTAKLRGANRFQNCSGSVMDDVPY